MLVLRRGRQPPESWDDFTIVIESLMRIEAKLDTIEQLVREEDDGEDQEGS
jgi:hypothetical protein